MEIDTVGIVTLVVAALIGAVVAGVVWRVLKSAFGWQTTRTVNLGIIALGMVIAIPLLPGQVMKFGGSLVRTAVPAPDLLEKSKEDPFIARLLTDHPDLSEPLEQRLVEAYRKGGREGVALEETRFGQEVAISPRFNYFVRARSADLVKVMTMQRDVLVEMAESEPEICHPFLFGADGDDQATLQRINEAIPDELSDLTIQMIVHAYEEVPYYDRAAGRQLIYEAQTKTTLLFGDDGMALLAGEKRPATPVEEKTVCLVFVSVLSSMLAEGEVSASLGFRAMFDAG